MSCVVEHRDRPGGCTGAGAARFGRPRHGRRAGPVMRGVRPYMRIPRQIRRLCQQSDDVFFREIAAGLNLVAENAQTYLRAAEVLAKGSANASTCSECKGSGNQSRHGACWVRGNYLSVCRHRMDPAGLWASIIAEGRRTLRARESVSYEAVWFVSCPCFNARPGDAGDRLPGCVRRSLEVEDTGSFSFEVQS